MTIVKKPSAAAETSARAKKSSPAPVARSLRQKLNDAEQALAAIRTGEVDALVIFHPAGDRVFTLEGAEHGYRLLLEAMSEGVATLTKAGVITYCNARFSAILGAPLEQTIGSSMSSLIPESERERFQSMVTAGKSGRSHGKFWLHPPDLAAPILVRLAVVPLVIDDAPTHCVVMTDVTEQHAQDAAIAAERAQMQTRLLLADRMSSLGTLAAGVAHEINNPLAYVITSLELMSARFAACPAPELVDVLAAQLARPLERAREGAERVRLIVRGLKAFSRADDERVGVIDPRRALDMSIALVEHEICLRAKLVKDFATLPEVWANEGRLEQVFVNLLVNAAQAIPAGAASQNEIRVSGRTDAEGRAVIEIRDTGAGIEADHLARIFDPFFTTKPLDVGTGLGLSLCHAVIASLDGKITVESEIGKGTVFRVVLPAVRSDALPAEAATAMVSTPSHPRGRLLFIDDEADLCEVMRESLTHLHDIVTTSDPHEALAWLAKGERFDLIFCDVRMPEMTGLEFYSRLATDNPVQADLVVLMSGGFTRRPGDVPATMKRPVLEKPFAISQVLSLMQGAMA